jgi:hypothetical protein
MLRLTFIDLSIFGTSESTKVPSQDLQVKRMETAILNFKHGTGHFPLRPFDADLLFIGTLRSTFKSSSIS